jgi:hypothetical protein
MSLGTAGLENGSAATEEFAAQEAGGSEVKDAAWLAQGANRRAAAVRSDRVSMDFIRVSFVGQQGYSPFSSVGALVSRNRFRLPGWMLRQPTPR